MDNLCNENESEMLLLSCFRLCDSTDCGLPGLSVHGILQARTLEWVATPFSRDHLDPGIKHRSPALQADYLQPEPPIILLYIPQVC